MAASQHRQTVCDPVHRILDFGAEQSTKALVKGIVDSRPFQRLRRISQLGLASYVFPGATHSRFSHCLGAGHLARQVTQQLLETSDANRWDELRNHEQLLIAAGLLHDVGHGPFSHSFERALKKILGREVDHESWTRAIIRGPLRDTLDRNGVNADTLANSFSESSHVPKYIRQIVSSQLDVDRMDYLVRDAHFSGVPLGNIDLHYLIRSLLVVEYNPEHATLGLSRKGVKPYEGFALARHLMNRSVYFHAKVATLEFMMEECLAAIVEGIKAGSCDISGIPQCLVELSNTQLKSDALTYCDDNLAPYLQLTEDHIWTTLSFVEARWTGRAQDFASRILSRQVPKYFYVRRGQAGELTEILAKSSIDPQAYEVKSTKSKVYSENADDDAVHVQHEDGTTSAVTLHSFGLNAYAGKNEFETVLIVLNDKLHAAIEKVAAKCIERRPSADALNGSNGVNARSSSDPSPLPPT